MHTPIFFRQKVQIISCKNTTRKRVCTKQHMLKASENFYHSKSMIYHSGCFFRDLQPLNMSSIYFTLETFHPPKSDEFNKPEHSSNIDSILTTLKHPSGIEKTNQLKTCNYKTYAS